MSRNYLDAVDQGGLSWGSSHEIPPRAQLTRSSSSREGNTNNEKRLENDCSPSRSYTQDRYGSQSIYDLSYTYKIRETKYVDSKRKIWMLREEKTKIEKRKAQSSLTRSVDVSGGGSIIPCSFCKQSSPGVHCWMLPSLSFFFLLKVTFFPKI